MHPENDRILLWGFGLAGYRSFGPNLQRFGPCGTINLIIGQNNSGKSNALLFLAEYGESLRLPTSRTWKLTDTEIHQSKDQTCTIISLAINKSKAKPLWIQNIPGGRINEDESIDEFFAVLEEHSPCDGGFWIDAKVPIGSDSAEFSTENFVEHSSRHRLSTICARIRYALDMTRTSDIEADFRRVIHSLLQAYSSFPRPITIPTLRTWGTDVPSSDFSGRDIVLRLAALQNPEHHEQQKRAQFDRIQEFVREVIDRPEARIEVPHSRKTLVVHMDNRSLPLESLGTGIHEVIILAAAATILQKQIICIEEPEIHLHPLLQKKLLRYLDNKTSNQYFISTHSAHLLDHPAASIFHVRLTEQGSQVQTVIDTTSRFQICADLGYHASDLLQSNCIIWVEGPSDRVYIIEWLRLIDPSLQPDIDYSVMFYGGRLLSHLSTGDPDVSGFISLRRINRNMVIIIDSDKRSSKSQLNPTKHRIVSEWGHEHGFPWVTDGREIENYVPKSSMLEILESLYPQGNWAAPKTKWTKILSASDNRFDKIRIARALVEEGKLTLDYLDLRSKICELANFIRQSSGNLV